MTDRTLIGPKPEAPEVPPFLTPWMLSYRVVDGESEAFLHDSNGRSIPAVNDHPDLWHRVAEAVNAYYGGGDSEVDELAQQLSDERRLVDEKDARIAVLSSTLDMARADLIRLLGYHPFQQGDLQYLISEVDLQVGRLEKDRDTFKRQAYDENDRAAELTKKVAELEKELEHTREACAGWMNAWNERAAAANKLQREVRQLKERNEALVKNLEDAERRAYVANDLVDTKALFAPREPKVGDRARVTRIDNPAFENVVGKLGVLKKMDPGTDLPYKVEMDDGYAWWVTDVEVIEPVPESYTAPDGRTFTAGQRYRPYWTEEDNRLETFDEADL